MTIEQVLLTASQFTAGEPWVMALPAAAGCYLVGNCDYDGYLEFIRHYAEIWQGQRPQEPTTTPAAIAEEIAFAKAAIRRIS